jgi:predicted porin
VALYIPLQIKRGKSMNKSPFLFGVVTLACAAGAAHAQTQSQVTVFGVLDVAYQMNTASGAPSQNLMINDGNTSSRFGFRGVEELGAGMKASFHFEGAVAVTTGAGGATSINNSGANTAAGVGLFGRRSTVSLIVPWGELRAGRDYVPTFNNLTTAMHPFGTNGLGNAGQLFYPVAAGGTTARTNVRASNSLAYLLPADLGGFNGHFMVAQGLTGTTGATADNGNYVGGRLGYAAGPLSLAAATGQTKYNTGDYTQSNFGINYKVGPAKLMYLYGKNEVGITNTTIHMIGTQYDVGSGQVRAAYTTLKAEKVANDANQWTIGYVHDMSKRTALYANYSVVTNEGSGKTFSVGDGLVPTDAGGNSTGAQIGIRHSF